jgi:hypothetical protein
MNMKEKLTCKYCNEIFRDPVSLNCCGETICRSHINELLSIDDSNTFTCPFCNHENLNQNFNVNKLIQDLIGNEIHKFELDPKYVRLLNDLKMEIEKLATLLKDPENYIYEEMNEIKRQVDLDRESLKSEIDKLADGLIRELETCERNFKRDYKININLEDYSALVESSKKQLSECEKFFYLFSTKNEDREEKRNESQKIILQLQPKIKEFKENLFSNLVIKYKPMQSKNEDLFGKLKISVRFSI